MITSIIIMCQLICHTYQGLFKACYVILPLVIVVPEQLPGEQTTLQLFWCYKRHVHIATSVPSGTNSTHERSEVFGGEVPCPWTHHWGPKHISFSCDILTFLLLFSAFEIYPVLILTCLVILWLLCVGWVLYIFFRAERSISSIILLLYF